jgi:hypothetical protein
LSRPQEYHCLKGQHCQSLHQHSSLWIVVAFMGHLTLSSLKCWDCSRKASYPTQIHYLLRNTRQLEPWIIHKTTWPSIWWNGFVHQLPLQFQPIKVAKHDDQVTCQFQPNKIQIHNTFHLFLVQVMIRMVVYVHGFYIDMHFLGNVINDTTMSLFVVHAITLSHEKAAYIGTWQLNMNKSKVSWNCLEQKHIV